MGAIYLVLENNSDNSGRAHYPNIETCIVPLDQAERRAEILIKFYDSSIFKNFIVVGCWWLTSLILLSQEAEIRKTADQSQPEQIVHETLSQKKKNHKKGQVEWLKV
jgi:hypothetical protein